MGKGKKQSTPPLPVECANMFQSASLALPSSTPVESAMVFGPRFKSSSLLPATSSAGEATSGIVSCGSRTKPPSPSSLLAASTNVQDSRPLTAELQDSDSDSDGGVKLPTPSEACRQVVPFKAPQMISKNADSNITALLPDPFLQLIPRTLERMLPVLKTRPCCLLKVDTSHASEESKEWLGIGSLEPKETPWSIHADLELGTKTLPYCRCGISISVVFLVAVDGKTSLAFPSSTEEQTIPTYRFRLTFPVTSFMKGRADDRLLQSVKNFECRDYEGVYQPTSSVPAAAQISGVVKRYRGQLQVMDWYSECAELSGPLGLRKIHRDSGKYPESVFLALDLLESICHRGGHIRLIYDVERHVPDIVKDIAVPDIQKKIQLMSEWAIRR